VGTFEKNNENVDKKDKCRLQNSSVCEEQFLILIYLHQVDLHYQQFQLSWMSYS